MSLYLNLVRRVWPRQTLGVAYLEWQVQESRLVEARQRLARDYQAARGQAEQASIEPDQGILRLGRLRLDQPLAPTLMQAQERLQRTFTRLGRGFFRRLPSPLEVELAHYTAGMEQTCRSHRDLAARLRLAQGMMVIFQRQPEFGPPDCFRLALTSPESAWLLFHLRKKRLQDRQARLASPAG